MYPNNYYGRRSQSHLEKAQVQINTPTPLHGCEVHITYTGGLVNIFELKEQVVFSPEGWPYVPQLLGTMQEDVKTKICSGSGNLMFEDSDGFTFVQAGAVAKLSFKNFKVVGEYESVEYALGPQHEE